MSDALAPLEKLARVLSAHKYIITSVGSLAIYDHLLTLEDEVSYVWRREKSWISYLFIVNRYMLLCFVIFNESATDEYRHAQCSRNIFVVSTVGMTTLLLSDVFMTIRAYAVARRNRLIGLYLSSLICAKTIIGYYFISVLRPNAIPLPDIPITAFRTCTAAARSNHLQITTHGIGLVFDVSVFVIIIWFAYSDVGTGRFPSLLRNVVTDATVYFTMAMCIQTLVLFFLSFADPMMNQFPLIFYSVLIPILINRGVLSLKKTADANSTVNRAWSTGHFSNMNFEPMSMTVTSEIIISQPLIENEWDIYDHSDIPLDDLTLRKRSRSSQSTLGVAS